MDFFDENNRKFEKSMGVLALAIIIYISSYVLIRSNSTYIDEVDGCGPKGCETVKLSQGMFYLFYKPLIHADMRITHARFNFTN